MQVFCERGNSPHTPRPHHGRGQRQEAVRTDRVKRHVRAFDLAGLPNLLVRFTFLVVYPIVSTTSTRSGRLHDVRTRTLPDPANSTPAFCSDSHSTNPRTEDDNHRAA
jgi:tagatose-1,6-bisphosphate aldolase non-catalytic subunit AgaZ/GatZ